MVVGQQCAVRLLVSNVTRLYAGMSRTNAPKRSEPVRPRAKNVAISAKPAVRGRGGDFFRNTDVEKILPLPRLPGQGMFGWLPSIRRWAASCLILFRSHPARRRGYGPASQTCSVQVGRGNCISRGAVLRT